MPRATIPVNTTNHEGCRRLWLTKTFSLPVCPVSESADDNLRTEIDTLLTCAALENFVATRLADGARQHEASGARGSAEQVRYQARQHRIKALLARGQAAALAGHELPEDDEA